MIRILPREDIWEWLEWIELFESQGKKQKEFCLENGISPAKFAQRSYRIRYKSRSNPVLYEELVKIGREYMNSVPKPKQVKFCRKHDITKIRLAEIVSHLKYLDVIEEMKIEKGLTPMFIQIPHKDAESSSMEIYQASQPPVPMMAAPNSEVLPQSNDLEISLKQGVKVIISPQIDVTKIIKIIELLKDL